MPDCWLETLLRIIERTLKRYGTWVNTYKKGFEIDWNLWFNWVCVARCEVILKTFQNHNEKLLMPFLNSNTRHYFEFYATLNANIVSNNFFQGGNMNTVGSFRESNGMIRRDLSQRRHRQQPSRGWYAYHTDITSSQKKMKERCVLE